MSALLEAQRVLEIEAQAIWDLKDRLDDSFTQALEMICQCPGKIILTGMGKSGHIARKLAATFSSTGTPALFLHPTESSHGDLGLISDQDVLILISYGGNSQELDPLISFAHRRSIPLMALTGNPDSELSKVAQVTLDIHVKEEACPLQLAPTASTTATLALGDALAMAALKKKGFQKEDFAQLHPGGKLGRRLLTRVKDLMHTHGFAKVHGEEKVLQVLSQMSQSQVRGVAAVTNSQGELVGSITDGDIRRHLEKNPQPLETPLPQLMGKNPKSIGPEELAVKALLTMEQLCIQSLFVLDAEKKPLGLIHLQDLIKAQI